MYDLNKFKNESLIQHAILLHVRMYMPTLYDYYRDLILKRVCIEHRDRIEVEIEGIF